MPTASHVQPSKSGITTSETGERHIPASTRADGSVRKEIRVRPGYRPPEDVEVYKNRTAEAWKNRGSGVPGAETLNSPTPPSQISAATNKNAKRREARKRAAAIESEDKARGSAGSEKDMEQGEGALLGNGESPKPVDSQAEKEKEAKRLAKKLRQARDLKDKKDKGDTLLPEQFEKVIRINELIRQLDGLGFDTNGEKKSVA
ncbi:hypothetical protein AOQ84DRAFT_110376 [Glonium stellatum]|uniref:WIBG Mago-binding domain-containing protein n=1 Tax=Glonium stellatum TaxID=574774 RepID=A0A8E2JPY7_9PEZI|nr:hypothetical protein AOQ84DRAFT_110376 [Glonium stellatum]